MEGRPIHRESRFGYAIVAPFINSLGVALVPWSSSSVLVSTIGATGLGFLPPRCVVRESSLRVGVVQGQGTAAEQASTVVRPASLLQNIQRVGGREGAQFPGTRL